LFAGYKLSDAKVHVAYNASVVERVALLWDKDMSVMNNGILYIMGLWMLEMNCLVEIVVINLTGKRIVSLITSRNTLFAW